MSTSTGYLHMARYLAILFSGFLALTAIPGGVALIAGIGAPPRGLLAGTPFSSFVVPGFVLLLVVGGGAGASAMLTLRRHRLASFASLGTGLIIMTFEFVEVLTIGTPTGAGLVMQILYFALGAALVLISAGARHDAIRPDTTPEDHGAG